MSVREAPSFTPTRASAAHAKEAGNGSGAAASCEHSTRARRAVALDPARPLRSTAVPEGSKRTAQPLLLRGARAVTVTAGRTAAEGPGAGRQPSSGLRDVSCHPSAAHADLGVWRKSGRGTGEVWGRSGLRPPAGTRSGEAACRAHGDPSRWPSREAGAFLCLPAPRLPLGAGGHCTEEEACGHRPSAPTLPSPPIHNHFSRRKTNAGLCAGMFLGCVEREVQRRTSGAVPRD